MSALLSVRKPDNVPAISEVEELAALRSAIEAPVRPDDLRQGLEAFLAAAMTDSFQAPKGFRLIREEPPNALGLLAVLRLFTAKGWHGDHVTAIGMRIRYLMETLTEYDWVAVNLFTISEDHRSFEFDQRLIQAAATAPMKYDAEAGTFAFDKGSFINRLLYLLSSAR